MDNVVKLELVEVGEDFRFDPDEILEAAKGQGFTSLLIIGERPNGEDTWVSCSANAGIALVMMELAKRVIVP